MSEPTWPQFEQGIARDRSNVAAPRHEIKRWLEERKTTTAEKIADWKAKLHRAKLQSRAIKPSST